MTPHADDLDLQVGETLDHEMRMVREAIALVASGSAPRVVLANLRLSDQLLEPATTLARKSGVTVVPLWHADEEGLDLAIERRADAPA